jgi:hypothetical protein
MAAGQAGKRRNREKMTFPGPQKSPEEMNLSGKKSMDVVNT